MQMNHQCWRTYKYQMTSDMRRWLTLFETKQVGVLYHFTDFHTSWCILADHELKAKEGGGMTYSGSMFVIDRFRDWVSLTRNFHLMKTPAAGGEGIWGDTRIAIDGDKLAQHNRIEPYHDRDDYLTRQDNQAEERIRKRVVDLTGCIIQVDVLTDLVMTNATRWEDWVSEPDDEQKVKYTQSSRDDIATFFKWCQKEGIPANAVARYRPVRAPTI
jgi:hypothetical protein